MKMPLPLPPISREFVREHKLAVRLHLKEVVMPAGIAQFKHSGKCRRGAQKRHWESGRYGSFLFDPVDLAEMRCLDQSPLGAPHKRKYVSTNTPHKESASLHKHALAGFTTRAYSFKRLALLRSALPFPFLMHVAHARSSGFCAIWDRATTDCSSSSSS